MNTTNSTLSPLRVWDLPTRLFHWLLVAAVVGLVVTGNVGGNAMVWHFRLGYAAFALLLFRLIWGFTGGHWSRFAQFVYGPGTILRYLKGERQPRWLAGHNPLGALSVWVLLIFLSSQVISGLFSDDEIAFAGPLTQYVSSASVSWATRYHSVFGKIALIALVSLHVGAIFYYKFARQQNLITPMLLGDKPWPAAETLPASQDHARTRLLAAVVFALCCALVAWIVLKLGA